MEIIYAIGIIGFVVGVLLGKYAHHPLTFGFMIVLTLILIGGPIVLMAAEGMAALAIVVIIPAIIPPLIGYWVTFLVTLVNRGYAKRNSKNI